MGPTIIAAPHRGHAHVAQVSVAVVAAAVAGVDGAAGDRPDQCSPWSLCTYSERASISLNRSLAY